MRSPGSAVPESSLSYRINPPLDLDAVIDVYRSSGIRRPVDDRPRMAEMFWHANLVVTAYDGGRLVGVSRALTDYSYCCYLADLAVHAEYQRRGLGRELLARTKAAAGDRSTLLLLSAPNAMSYYPHIGMASADNAFLIPRKE
jgi:GNAT superfamily N-acetyltransferase